MSIFLSSARKTADKSIICLGIAFITNKWGICYFTGGFAEMQKQCFLESIARKNVQPKHLSSYLISTQDFGRDCILFCTL